MVKAYSTAVLKTGDDLAWKWQQENAELRKRLRLCETALEFYADNSNYKHYGYDGIRRVTNVQTDRGEKAREALEAFSSGTGYRTHASGE
ncbi:hypothetical protein MKY41_11565 [Sporosarcina sp. FSL W7-1349]|uniref:hypothetical protein n=1 Tax=Sporosarcina sp. FSL W7-1349 TaxID=2921561 RepID=UPI0030F72EB8